MSYHLIKTGTAAALLAAVFAADVQAEDWVAGDAGVCPDKIEGRSFQQIIAGESVPVGAPKADLYQTSNRIIPIEGGALEFGRRVEVLTVSENDDSTFLVKARRDGAVRCGWLIKRELLENVAPKKVVDLPGYGGEVGPTGDKSELFANIVARSSRDEENRLLAVPVFTWPSSERDGDAFRFAREEPLGYFSVASVMEVRRDEAADGAAGEHDSGCIDLNDEGCFILLGGTSKDGLGTLLGWVRGSDVELWPSALSIYFAEGKARVPYFFDECLAHFGVTKRDCTISEEFVDADGAPKPPPTGKHIPVEGNNIPRMPIISVSRAKAADDGRLIYFYDAVSALAICPTGSERIECRDSLDAVKRYGVEAILLERLRNVDVLFVIDATGSMDRYFDPVVKAAYDFANDIANDGIKARFSAVIYGDYAEENGTPDTVSLFKVTDFGGVGETGVLDPLLDAKLMQEQIDDAQKDQPEAPYAALAKAVSPGFLNWSEEAGLRLVVWIGDVGNRDPGIVKSRGPTGQVNETVSAEMVAAAIKAARFEGGTNIRVAAIHVPSRQDVHRDKNRVDFLSDYEVLRQALLKDGISNYNPREAGEAEADAQAQVRLALDAVKTAIEDGETAYRCGIGVTACAPPEEGAPADAAVVGGDDVVPVNPIGRELAAELGLLSAGEDAALGDGEVIAVERVYVRYDPANPDYQFWLGLRQTELETLIAGVRDLCSAMENFSYRKELAEAYRSVLSAATRERVDLNNISPQNFMAKQFSVPKSNFSHMLDLPFEEAATVFETDEDAANKLQASACIRFAVLSAVKNGKLAGVGDFEWSDGAVIEKPGVDLAAVERSFRWDWSGDGGGNKFYFFPLSFLP